MPPTRTREQFPVSDSRIVEVLELVCENVGPNWQDVATALGIPQTEIDDVKRRTNGSAPADACWDVVCRWRSRVPKQIMIRDLQDALRSCRQHRVADLVTKLMDSSKSMDEILSPHSEREGKMLDAMYIVVDGASNYWRTIAKHLKHTDRDIIAIESKFGGRTREKCMHALYRWRYLVPLKEYKIANLVMALRSSGLAKVAEEIKDFGNNETYSNRRKPKPDEIFIHVDITRVEVDSYIPTPEAGNTPVPGDISRDPTPRPKSILPNNLLKDYTLNKMFFHFLDFLELQEKTGAHPLVEWFYQTDRCCITEVSRKAHYLAVRCETGLIKNELRRMISNGEMSRVLNETLVTPIIRKELCLTGAKIHATEY